MLIDNIGNLAHLNARDTTLAVTAPAPLEESEPYRKRMGWTVPWYSAHGSDLLIGTLRYLDLTPFGRQEAWEESGRGTDAASSWWRLHDEY